MVKADFTYVDDLVVISLINGVPKNEDEARSIDNDSLSQLLHFELLTLAIPKK